MGRAKSIIILISFLILASHGGFCLEEDFIQDLHKIDERLEKLHIYFETEMYEQAATLLTELIAQYPDEPRFKYLAAIVDYQRGDYEHAEPVFTEFIEQYPDVAEPYYLLAEINLKQDNEEIARQYLTKYCLLIPEDFAARSKLDAISTQGAPGAVIMENGRGDGELVERIGFYGACVHRYQEQSLKLINGSHRSWSSMGIDFAYPLDLRGKQIVLKLKGKLGGERLLMTFRDKGAKDYNPQLVLTPEKSTSCYWQKIKVVLEGDQPDIDLSQVVHMGLEFGFSTAQNPANSTLFVKDIVIKDVDN